MNIKDSKIIRDFLAQYARPSVLVELHESACDDDTRELLDSVHFELTGNPIPLD